MTLRKVVCQALVYLVLEIGALCGVPMDPNKIEELMQSMKRNANVVERERDGDDKEPKRGGQKL